MAPTSSTVAGRAMGDKSKILRPRLRRHRQLRQITWVLGFCLVVYCFFFVYRTPKPPSTSSSRSPVSGQHGSPSSPTPRTKPLPKKILNNLSLTENECRATFPGLTQQIDDVVAQGPFKVKNTGDFGPLQGRIKDGQISILHTQRNFDLSREMINVWSWSPFSPLLSPSSPLPPNIKIKNLT